MKQKGFKETEIENETDEEYSYRTLKVILESNEINEVYNHPDVTYEACKWISMFNNCYISIWDSTKSKEDFIITDNGMNCEHDKSRFKTFNFDGIPHFNQRDEMIKRGYVFKKIIENQKNNSLKCFEYINLMQKMEYVHANYYLFAVSNTRTIALINPFFRLYNEGIGFNGPIEVPNVYPTLISRDAIKCNTQTYKKLGEYNQDDLFHYEIKDLSLEDVIIINNMMLDRVYKWVGFAEFSKIYRSLNVYSLNPFPRKKYDKLVNHLILLGYEFPKSNKYLAINDKLINEPFSKEEMECINLFMSSFDIKNKV